MAHIYPTGKRWRAQIALRGVRKSSTFATKAAATEWARREEAAILDGKASRWPAKTLGDALDRYEREVSPNKGAARFETVAFGLTRREHAGLCAKVLHSITAADAAAWRDARAAAVAPGTVLRYAGLLRAVWNRAALEWEWCPKENPWSQLRLPPSPAPRESVIGWRQARAMLRRLNYVTGHPPTTPMQQTAWAFLLGLRTAMRASELLGLTGADLDLSAGVVTLREHKTKHITGRARRVPLTPQGLRLLRVLAKAGPLFTVSAASRDALFRKARAHCGLAGFTFHDSRATAVTHLARRVDILTLARITGHRDITQLQGYYRETDAQIAARLAAPRSPQHRPTTSGTTG